MILALETFVFPIFLEAANFLLKNHPQVTGPSIFFQFRDGFFFDLSSPSLSGVKIHLSSLLLM